MALANWIPDRKVLAGGIVGVIAFFGGQALGLDPEMAAQIAGGLWMLVQYFVPASVMDVVNKIDDTIKKIGGNESTTVSEIKTLAASK